MDLAHPAHLLDAETIARNLWDEWVTLMKTDGLIESDEVPDWNEAEEEQRLCFLDAVAAQVVKPVKDYVDAVEFESSLDDTFNAARPTPPQHYTGPAREYPCYICARNVVYEYGKICATCHHCHID